MDFLGINAGVMFLLVIGIYGMGVGLASMIESRTLAGAAIRPGGAGLIVGAYALVLILLVVVGWSISVLVLRLGWDAALPENVPMVILLAVLGMVSFLGLGTVFAALGGNARSAQGICSASFFPLLFLSGAVFPLESFPSFVQQLAEVLPGHHVTAAFTWAWFSGEPVPSGSLVYLALMPFPIILLALWALNRREDV